MFSFVDRSWLWVAGLLYLAGFALGTVALLRERRHSHAWMYTFLAVGFAAQSVGLYLRGRAVHGCPLTNTFELFQFTAWSATSLYLVIGPTFRLSLLGYFNACLSTSLSLVSLLVPAWDALHRAAPASDSPWIKFHAALALFSYGVFGLLALTSIMYLLQLFSLKRQHLRGFFSFLPSIVDLDHINTRLLTAGVIIMTSALSVGAVHWLSGEVVHPMKIIVTSGLWLSYAVALLLRWRGLLITKRLAWTCIVLFVVALFSLGPIGTARKSLPPPAPAQSSS